MTDKTEGADFRDEARAHLVRPAGVADALALRGRFVVECRDPLGNLRWRAEVENVVTILGRNLILDAAFPGGTTIAALFLGLISSVGFTGVVETDTMSVHPGWNEAGASNAPNYSGSSRPTLAFAAASGGSKATSAPAIFTSSQTGTASGCFLATVATKDGTTGVLVSGGPFTEGPRDVLPGDQISASWSVASTSA